MDRLRPRTQPRSTEPLSHAAAALVATRPCVQSPR